MAARTAREAGAIPRADHRDRLVRYASAGAL